MRNATTTTPATIPAGFRRVDEKQFFAYVGPRDIIPRALPDRSEWETRERVLVGITEPGYRGEYGAPRVYLLSEAAHARIAASAAAAATARDAAPC